MKHEFGFNIFLFAKIASAVTYTTDVFFGVLADVTKIKDFWDAKTLFLLRQGSPPLGCRGQFLSILYPNRPNRNIYI